MYDDGGLSGGTMERLALKRSGDGANEGRRSWRADLFCAASPAAHAR
jgi:hypothetical protein